jgi:hypothetical protein
MAVPEKALFDTIYLLARVGEGSDFRSWSCRRASTSAGWMSGRSGSGAPDSEPWCRAN